MNATGTKDFQLVPIEKLALKNFTSHRLAIFSAGRIFMNEERALPHASSILNATKDGTSGALTEVFSSATREAKTFFVGHNIIFLFVKSENSHFLPLRDAFSLLSDADFQSLLAGVQLAQWSETHLYCSGCAKKLEISQKELAKVCEACQRNFYPQLSPAVIMLIHRMRDGHREILLARGLPPRKFHSCLAGFVEAGETFEQTIHREVFEEVGVKVHNLKYFGSQPWPFPSQIMIGFYAEWASGEIKIDPAEITEARWYGRDNLPELPISKSIARQLIEHALTEKGPL